MLDLEETPVQRREFLKLAAIGVFASLADSTDAAESASMTLGYSTYGCRSLTTEKAIDQLSEIGFDSIELCLFQGWDAAPEKMKPSRRREIQHRLEDRGMRLTSLMEHLHIDDANQTAETRLERIRHAASLAHDLSPENPPLLQTTLGGRSTGLKVASEWVDQVTRELELWLKLANEVDLQIAIKPHRIGGLSLPVHAIEVIRRLGTPKRMSICFDYSHYDLRGVTLTQAIQSAIPFVGHVAVKDAMPDGDSIRFVLPGESGRVDYAEMLRQLHNAGYCGDVCCEPSAQVWSKPDFDPIAAARVCYTNLSSAFTNAGISRKATIH